MPEKETTYKKYFSYIKDAIYIIGIFVAMGGWIASETKSRAILETTVKHNTEIVNKLETFVDEQAELNGKFIQFMVMTD